MLLDGHDDSHGHVWPQPSVEDEWLEIPCFCQSNFLFLVCNFLWNLGSSLPGQKNKCSDTERALAMASA